MDSNVSAPSLARSNSVSAVLLDGVNASFGPLFGFMGSRFPSPRSFTRSNSLSASFDGGLPLGPRDDDDDVHSLGAGASQTLAAVAAFLADTPAVKRETSLLGEHGTQSQWDPAQDNEAQPLPPVKPDVTNAMVVFNVGCELNMSRVVAGVPGATKGEKPKDKSVYLSNRARTADLDSSDENRKGRRLKKSGKPAPTGKAKEFADLGGYKAQIWPSGKVNVYAKTVEAATRSAHEVVSKLKAVNSAVAMHDFKVSNVVGEVACGFALHLEALHRKYAHCSSYNPNARSPEVNFKMDCGVKFRIFATGRISIQGAKSMESVYDSFAVLYGIVKDFNVKNSNMAVD